MEPLACGLVILLTEMLDGVSLLQFVDGEDIVFPDGGVQVGEVVVDMLCHLAVGVVEWESLIPEQKSAEV